MTLDVAIEKFLELIEDENATLDDFMKIVDELSVQDNIAPGDAITHLYTKVENNKDFINNGSKYMGNKSYYGHHMVDVDYMKIARYVTDCKNAIAGIHAKNIEMKALETDIAIAKLLLDAGEISQLEYSEKEILLEKARFELEGQYVQMNISHWQLMMICK